jgi:hypothetical protein
VNPKATPSLVEEITQLVREAGHSMPVSESALARYSTFLPF